MGKSLFHKDTPENRPPNPLDLIEKEVEHLKKGSSVRHGGKRRSGTAPWLIILGALGLAWLYLMDPCYHAWYKGEAVRAYLYLHAYGSPTDTDALVESGILTAEDLDTLNHRTGSYQEYYKGPDAALKRAQAIVAYMREVQLLHAGKYEQLDPVGRMRYALFVKPGLVLPTDWAFLDPTVN
jgi:hypothetical protein